MVFGNTFRVVAARIFETRTYASSVQSVAEFKRWTVLVVLTNRRTVIQHCWMSVRRGQYSGVDITWSAAYETVSLVSFLAAAVAAVIRVDTNGMLGAGIMNIARSLTCSIYACFANRTVFVCGATH